jgi:sensor histidine kinase regulating citrate/malate metabolism
VKDLVNARMMLSQHHGERANAIRAIAFRADNAVDKAPSTEGTISVSTRCIDDWAEIRIQDTGCGIPMEIRAGEGATFTLRLPLDATVDEALTAACGVEPP